jgi:hypothetical protein
LLLPNGWKKIFIHETQTFKCIDMKKTKSEKPQASNSSIDLWGLKANFTDEPSKYRRLILWLFVSIIIFVILVLAILLCTGHWQIPALGGAGKIILWLKGRSP